MFDAHCHLDKENKLLKILTENNISATINCQNEKEWRHHHFLTKQFDFLTLSAGIHPWDADKFTFKEFEPILKETSIIGEIGMDNEWTDVSLNSQKNIFIEQLAFAYEHQKPVILHTKGQEKEILDIIKDYPNHYLVHWYSANHYLQDYIALDCYFTVGPSVGTDIAVQEVVKQVPLNRLLVETDGLEALAWAVNLPVNKLDYLKIQHQNSRVISNLKETQTSCIVAKLEENYNQWLNLSKETHL